MKFVALTHINSDSNQIQAWSQSDTLGLVSTLRYDPELLNHAKRMPDAIRESEDGLFLIKIHYERLRYGANLLGWPIDDLDYFRLKDAVVRNIIEYKYTEQPCRVRVVLKRDAALVVTVTPVSTRFDLFSGTFDANGTNDVVYDVVLDVKHPLVKDISTTIKTTDRAQYDEAREQANISTAGRLTEVLLVDDSGYLVEGSITSLAVERNGEWITPSGKHGGQCGVLKSFLLESHIITPGSIHSSDINQDTKIILFNGVIGVCSARLKLEY